MSTHFNEVTQRQSDGALAQARGRTAESAMRAPADVYEDQEGLTLVADMPGVSRERLDVRVDGDKLLLEGSVQFELPEQAEALYADVRSTLYRRSFALSRELDTAQIQATLKDGVLTVRIPKRAELRPRKIEVKGP
ncbi:MAG: Hsp20/alpha crystallin family protein [Gammaproteobacteria bacterium]|nr:MAG: Hsp20/alpha crystallin family protein [Gammaproteobacteria bacterium]